MAIIIGNGGHARALAHRYFPGENVRMLGPNEEIPIEGDLIIGMGDVKTRRVIFRLLESRIAYNQQIMAGVLIGPHVHLGKNILINTGAQIDHDCVIGDHCSIAPGAILCGGVTLGEGCFIGAGAIIVENVTLEPNTFIPAGSLVVKQDDIRMPQRVVQNG